MKISIVSLVIWFSHNSIANFDLPINFTGPLNQSCEFIKDENILTTLDSLTLTLSDIRTAKDKCKSIYTNSRTYLNSITQEINTRNSQLEITKKNIETVSEEIYRRTQEGTYANEYDYDLLTLLQTQNQYENETDSKNDHLINALGLGSTILNDLSANPECDEGLSNLLIKPTSLLLGQVSGAIYPGSSLFVSGALTALGEIFESFTSFTLSKFGKVEGSLDDLINSTNYYKSYKCAYKNLNSMTCALRENRVSKKHAKKLRQEISALDTDEQDFQRIADLRKHYPRINAILTQIKEIYETAQQQDTIVAIASIQKERTQLRLLRPNPYETFEWNDNYQNLKNWKDWNQSLTWTQYLSAYLKTNCKIYATDNDLPIYNISSDDCQPESLLTDASRTAFILEVIQPSLEQVNQDLLRLSQKLRDSVNIERLYYAIRAEQDYSDRIKKYSLTELLRLFQTDLDSSNRPRAIAMFSDRINLTIRAINALVSYEGTLENNVESIIESECDISNDNYNCVDFEELSQAVYTFLANELSGGDVLSVEMIDATFYNYISGVEDYFLNGRSIDFSLQYSQYSYKLEMYRSMRKILLSPSGQGISDLPLMNQARKSFEKVFSYEISKKLERDVDKALSGKSHGDYHKEALHACVIYNPMLRNRDSLTKSNIKRKKMKKVLQKCDDLILASGGLDILVLDSEKFPLRGYNRQCYYREYERAVTIRSMTLARDLDNDDDLPDL